MKKKLKRILTFWISILLLFALCGNSLGAESAEAVPSGENGAEQEGIGIDLLRNWKKDNSSEDNGDKERDPNGQLTEDDIAEMNDGDYTILHSEDGYVTFIRGKYYEEKVMDQEDGIKSLFGIQSLLGLSKGSEFFAVFGFKNAQGYTYYVYQQRYGDITLQNAVLKVIVDPEGYTCGLVSSFVPNVGIAPEDETSISVEEAMEIVKEQYPDDELLFFEDAVRQTSVTYDGIAYHCWAIFTDIPFNGGMIGDRRFLEHLVAYDGTYLGYSAVMSTTELEHGDDVPVAIALSWFEDKIPETYTATVTLCDGTRRELTVPVAKDEITGKYYLADLERHILVADYYGFVYEGQLLPMTSNDNTGWPEEYLLTYESYIRVYDYYDNFGTTSVDGFGMPILIMTEACNYDGSPIDNAFFAGFDRGWATFGANDINNYGECIDVIGHEFTHGITSYTLAGDLYEGETGAVNEALSDIMGNICEMLLQATEDTTWMIAENRGEDALRSMSVPWLHQQPVKVGGTFYIPSDVTPTNYNDWGGVHTNSSLVNYIAWQLCAQGLSLEDSYFLWKEAINMLTPLSGFREIHHALIFAGLILDLDVEWLVLINMICEQAGY